MGRRGVDFTPAVRSAMYERDGFRCVRCGRYCPGGVGLDAHHRRLRSQGGMGTLENGISLCGSGTTGCHGWVHAHPMESYEAGWLVHSWDDPAEIPWRTWADRDGTGAEHGHDGLGGSETAWDGPGWDRADSVAGDGHTAWQWPA